MSHPKMHKTPNPWLSISEKLRHSRRKVFWSSVASFARLAPTVFGISNLAGSCSLIKTCWLTGPLLCGLGLRRLKESLQNSSITCEKMWEKIPLRKNSFIPMFSVIKHDTNKQARFICRESQQARKTHI